ncbi:MAG: glutathione peroxidase [Cellvibrionales bacterium]|nr:glutathione peroxidase [Cellvibrionales bacterium]
MTESIYDLSVSSMQGEQVPLKNYQGKVLLIVNTASKCGLTPQFKELEEIYQDYKDKGLEILGFPCNQFANQDPKSNEEILDFCQTNYGVTFPMFAKIDVNGDDADPLFKLLKADAPGLLGSESVKWNFTKFIVDRNGKVVKRIAPKDNPTAAIATIEELL